MSIKKTIVLGSLFGDEGKGVTTQWLCQQALDAGEKPLVVRFCGGPQAGHTIMHNGVTHVCSTYGSGTLLGIRTYIARTAYFDPICAWNEYQTLCDKIGEENVPKLFVNSHCRVITPWDVLAGRSDDKVVKDGTCGKGLYATFRKYGMVWGEDDKSIFDDATSFGTAETCWERTKHYYKHLLPYAEYSKLMEEAEDFKKMFFDAWTEMWDKIEIDDTSGLYIAMDDIGSDHIIFEGSQGLLLDMERGFYPNVTPSKVGLNGLSPEFLQDADVYFVMRTYLTRHGNGYEPRSTPFLEQSLEGKYESNIHNTWQGAFKVGWHEQKLLDQAYERHCIDNYRKQYNQKHYLMITHADIYPPNVIPLPRYDFDGLWACYSEEGMIKPLPPLPTSPQRERSR